MNISSWTVRMRLTVGFGVVCALMFVIVGVGIFSMDRVEAGVVEITDDRVPKIDASNTILIQVGDISNALRDMMLTSDAGLRQKHVDGIVQSRGVIKKNVELLDQLVASSKSKELLAQVKLQRTQYIAGQDALIALIQAEKADEAKTYLDTALRPVQQAYQAAIRALIASQVEQMEDAAKAGVETEKAQDTQMILGNPCGGIANEAN